MATLINTDGTETPVRGEGPHGRITLQQCRAAIGCSCIDRVVTCDDFEREFPKHELVVDDEALFVENPTLNVRASKIAGQPIVGNVLVVRYDADGNWY